MSLPIADRRWEPGAPEEGWCGETSIQLAAGWYGAYVSQKTVNALGHPKTPDLWEHDVPVALEAMHLKFERGPQKRGDALKWIVEQLRLNRPVVLGVKIIPTEHPEWKVDHLVLAVGFSPQRLLIDTNAEEGQITVSWSGLQRPEGDQEYSLVNQTGEVFAFAVSGFENQSPLPIRVLIADGANVDVTMPKMLMGAHYELLRGDEVIDSFMAKGTSRTWRFDVSPDELVRFSAREAPAK
jgi:hypothetical protein